MGRSRLCSLGVCHIRGYVIRDYVAFMIMLNWFSVVWDCVVAVNVARVNVVRDYVVWYTLPVCRFPVVVIHMLALLPKFLIGAGV